MHRRLLHVILTLLCTAGCLRAQEPLTTLDAVQALPAAEAVARHPVKLHGILTATSYFAPRAILMCEGRALYVFFPNMAAVPPPNVEAIITGTTRRGQFRGRESAEEIGVDASRVEVLARDVAPEPLLQVPLEALQNGQHRDRWLETEGTVLQMQTRDGDLNVMLAGESGFYTFFFRDWSHDAPPPQEWIGSRLRVRGVVLGHSGEGRLAVHGQMNVTVVRQGPANPFSCPEAKAADLQRTASGSSDRMRFTATVLRLADNRQWLRASDGTAALCFFHEAMKPDRATPQLTSPVPAIPSLHAGDVVEVSGCPLSDGVGLLLRHCHMRLQRSNGDTSPRPASVAEIARGAQQHDLVTVTGRFTTQGVVTLQPGQQYEGVRLNAGSSTELEVYYQSPDGGKLPRLSPDHLIEAIGYAMPGPTVGSGRLLLRSPADLRSLGIAPEVTRMRQWRTIGIGSGIVVLGIGFILMLRRRLIKERALAGEVRLLNTTLEQRVADRTAELETAREDLKAALKEEREVGELKSRFVSTVSHEFRTPLGVIMSATDIIARYRDRLPPERLDEHLTEIRHATRHMSSMMEDILLLGKADAGRLPVSPQPCDLLELCHRLADETRSASHQTGQTIITSNPLPGPAMVDEMVFRHMFNNLLSNAVKYSPEGAPVEVHVSADGPHAIVTITDHGIGIPPEDAARLFEPFARAGNVAEHPGTGLGLVVVKRCAELHGGTVTFISTLGEGTTFTIKLPVFRGM